jgi:hypothetical protein
MPALTRRRYPERRDDWQVYYGDMLAHRAPRTPNPTLADAKHDKKPPLG